MAPPSRVPAFQDIHDQYGHADAGAKQDERQEVNERHRVSLTRRRALSSHAAPGRVGTGSGHSGKRR